MSTRKFFLAATVALATLSAHAGPVEVRDFDIFVDPPTAFVFVKLPRGWKFVDKIDAKSLTELPVKIHTSLLSPDEGKRIADTGRAAGSINSATSASQLYWENNNNFNVVEQRTREIKVPVGVTVFPGEIYKAPKSWAQRAHPKLTYFNEVDRGGPFGAWEEPQLFAQEVRAAFHSLRE